MEGGGGGRVHRPGLPPPGGGGGGGLIEVSSAKSQAEPLADCPRGQGGGDWHDARLCCCQQRAVPIGLSPLTLALPLNPLPPHTTATPIAPPPPSSALPPPLPGLPSPPPHPLPFPSGGCATAAPGLSLLHCPVSGPHGGRRRPSPLAKGVQAAVGDPSPRAPGAGGGLAQGLGIYLFAFGGAYWPLTTAHSDPPWAQTCFGCVNGAPG